jgi:hypothetical protein
MRKNEESNEIMIGGQVHLQLLPDVEVMIGSQLHLQL